MMPASNAKKTAAKTPATPGELPFDPSGQEKPQAEAEQSAETPTKQTKPQRDPRDATPKIGESLVREVTMNVKAEFAVELTEVFSGYASPRADFRMTRRQAAAAKILWCSLSKRGERYQRNLTRNPNGSPVENTSGALSWLLDRIADAIEQQTEKDLEQDFDLMF